MHLWKELTNPHLSTERRELSCVTRLICCQSIQILTVKPHNGKCFCLYESKDENIDDIEFEDILKAEAVSHEPTMIHDENAQLLDFPQNDTGDDDQDSSEDVRTKVLNKAEMSCADLTAVEETSLDKEDDIEESLLANYKSLF